MKSINIKTWQVRFQRTPILNKNCISKRGLHGLYRLEKTQLWRSFLVLLSIFGYSKHHLFWLFYNDGFERKLTKQRASEDFLQHSLLVGIHSGHLPIFAVHLILFIIVEMTSKYMLTFVFPSISNISLILTKNKTKMLQILLTKTVILNKTNCKNHPSHIVNVHLKLLHSIKLRSNVCCCFLFFFGNQVICDAAVAENRHWNWKQHSQAWFSNLGGSYNLLSKCGFRCPMKTYLPSLYIYRFQLFKNKFVHIFKDNLLLTFALPDQRIYVYAIILFQINGFYFLSFGRNSCVFKNRIWPKKSLCWRRDKECLNKAENAWNYVSSFTSVWQVWSQNQQTKD